MPHHLSRYHPKYLWCGLDKILKNLDFLNPQSSSTTPVPIQSSPGFSTPSLYNLQKISQATSTHGAAMEKHSLRSTQDRWLFLDL